MRHASETGPSEKQHGSTSALEVFAWLTLHRSKSSRRSADKNPSFSNLDVLARTSRAAVLDACVLTSFTDPPPVVWKEFLKVSAQHLLCCLDKACRADRCSNQVRRSMPAACCSLSCTQLREAQHHFRFFRNFQLLDCCNIFCSLAHTWLAVTGCWLNSSSHQQVLPQIAAKLHMPVANCPSLRQK